MGYFPVRYNSRAIIYDRKMFIRLATDCRVVEFTLVSCTFQVSEFPGRKLQFAATYKHTLKEINSPRGNTWSSLVMPNNFPIQQKVVLKGNLFNLT